ncbi:MAG: hypothetical protein QMB51_01995 [Patescibacteria group bacterium]
MESNEFILSMDPDSGMGREKFMKHQKMFLQNYCHFAQGNDNVVCAARIGLFGKLYRVAWLRILESRQWSDEELFLGFVDFFMGHVSNDQEVIHLIDERKWYYSEASHKDVFPDFLKMQEIGEYVVRCILDKYFPPCTSEEEKLSLVIA